MASIQPKNLTLCGGVTGGDEGDKCSLPSFFRCLEGSFDSSSDASLHICYCNDIRRSHTKPNDVSFLCSGRTLVTHRGKLTPSAQRWCGCC